MPKTKRVRTVITITMDPIKLAEMRKHCDENSLTYSGFIQDAVEAYLKEKNG
jgi:hypothetical protein